MIAVFGEVSSIFRSIKRQHIHGLYIHLLLLIIVILCVGSDTASPLHLTAFQSSLFRYSEQLDLSAIEKSLFFFPFSDQMYLNNVLEFCIIVTDENECNWMMFVRKAR